jgi:hypothetical protein
VGDDGDVSQFHGDLVVVATRIERKRPTAALSLDRRNDGSATKRGSATPRFQLRRRIHEIGGEGKGGRDDAPALTRAAPLLG